MKAVQLSLVLHLPDMGGPTPRAIRVSPRPSPPVLRLIVTPPRWVPITERMADPVAAFRRVTRAVL